VDGRQRQALSGVPLGVVQHLLVGPASGSLHPGRQPVKAHRLAGADHLGKPAAQVVQGADEAAVGLAVPQRRQRAEQQVRPRSWRCRPLARRGGTTARRGRPPRRHPGGPPTAAAGCHHARVGGVGSGGPGGGPARPARGRAATNAGRMTTGPDLQAGFSTLPMVWSRSPMSTPSITLDVRGSVPLIMTCVHWGWPRSHPTSVRPDLRARPNSPRGPDPPRNQPTSYGAPVISWVTSSWPTRRHARRSRYEGTLPWQRR
jgi:hypothetical protein